jgi:hypothetical protein
MWDGCRRGQLSSVRSARCLSGVRWRPSRPPTYDDGPNGVGRHYKDPAHVYPVVVDERPAIRLEAAVIQCLDLAVQAPVAQMSLGQYR